METNTTKSPILLSTRWLEAKTSEGRIYGASVYSPIGEYIYRRRPHHQKKYEYSRVLYSKVYLLVNWYEIEESWWEPVDVYGIPVIPIQKSC